MFVIGILLCAVSIEIFFFFIKLKETISQMFKHKCDQSFIIINNIN